MRRELLYAATRLLPAAVDLYLVLAGTGLLLIRVLSGGVVIRADERASRWFFEHRTAELNSLTHVGSMLSRPRRRCGSTTTARFVVQRRSSGMRPPGDPDRGTLPVIAGRCL